MATADGKITRSVAARLLGVSLTTVRRLEGDVLHPQLVDGQHVFDVTEVKTVAWQRRDANNSTPTGEVAALVFSLLDEGVHPIEIVKRTSQDVDVVERLYDRWTTWRRRMDIGNDLRVSKRDVQGIIDSFPALSMPVRLIENVDDLLRLIQRLGEEATSLWSEIAEKK